MQHSEELDLLATALCEAQADIRHPFQNEKNPHLKNRFADLKGCIDTLRPALAKHGLLVVQTVGGTDGVVEVTTTLLHKSGQWLSDTAGIPIEDGRGINKYQSFGSGVTYLRRYALSAVAGVASDPDTDGNVGNGEAKKEAAPSSKGKFPDERSLKPLGEKRVSAISDRLASISSDKDRHGWPALREWLVNNGQEEVAVNDEPHKWPEGWLKCISDFAAWAEKDANGAS